MQHDAKITPAFQARSGAAPAAPAGQIAYRKGDAAYVAPAAGGPATRLPRSEGAWQVSLSPRDGTALYFVAPGGANPAGARGFVSRPPYREARPLPPPLDKGHVPQVIWTADGKKAFLSARDLHGAYDPATGRFQRLGPVGPSGLHSASRDGRVAAFATDDAVKVLWPGTGKQRTLFSAAKPQPLFAALDNAKRPDKVRALRGVDPAMWRKTENWQIGPPAVAPDGKNLFFAANAGLGMGAAGNTSFCLFAADAETGKLSVLSKLGTFFGRVPEQCAVSPDGGRLLFVFSEHSSAIDNPRSAWVVDLLTQQARELLRTDPKHKNRTNLTDGACWSPDGRHVALSVVYYDVAAVLERARRTERPWEPKDDDYVLRIADAATGRTVRQIAGARQPSWSRAPGNNPAAVTAPRGTAASPAGRRP